MYWVHVAYGSCWTIAKSALPSDLSLMGFPIFAGMKKAQAGLLAWAGLSH